MEPVNDEVTAERRGTDDAIIDNDNAATQEVSEENTIDHKSLKR